MRQASPQSSVDWLATNSHRSPVRNGRSSSPSQRSRANELRSLAQEVGMASSDMLTQRHVGVGNEQYSMVAGLLNELQVQVAGSMQQARSEVEALRGEMRTALNGERGGVRSQEMATYARMLQESEERLVRGLQERLRDIQDNNQKSLENLSSKLDRQIDALVRDNQQIEAIVSAFRTRVANFEQQLQESADRYLGMVQSVSERHEWTCQLVENMQANDVSKQNTLMNVVENVKNMDASVKHVDAEMQKIQAEERASRERQISRAQEACMTEQARLISELEVKMNQRFEDASEQHERRYEILCTKIGKMIREECSSFYNNKEMDDRFPHLRPLTTRNVESLSHSYHGMPSSLESPVKRTYSPNAERRSNSPQSLRVSSSQRQVGTAYTEERRASPTRVSSLEVPSPPRVSSFEMPSSRTAPRVSRVSSFERNTSKTAYSPGGVESRTLTPPRVIERSYSPGSVERRAASPRVIERQVTNPKYTAESVTTYFPLSHERPSQPITPASQTPRSTPIRSSSDSRGVSPTAQTLAGWPFSARTASSPVRMSSMPTMPMARSATPPAHAWLIGNAGFHKQGYSLSSNSTTLTRSSTTTIIAEGAS